MWSCTTTTVDLVSGLSPPTPWTSALLHTALCTLCYTQKTSYPISPQISRLSLMHKWGTVGVLLACGGMMSMCTLPWLLLLVLAGEG